MPHRHAEPPASGPDRAASRSEPARTVWLGTSWKMTKTIPEAREYAAQLARASRPPGVQAFVLPAHTALAAVRDILPADGSVMLGAQNAHWAPEGAGTGEVSMRMVADAGARIVELGHSERRGQFGESDATVALKVRAAADAGLTPLLCIGEPLPIREAGRQEVFVLAQLRAALAALNPAEVSRTLVAYEPVWAIGPGGRPATPVEVAPVVAALRTRLSDLSDGGGPLALLYGGGVDAAGALNLLDVPGVDGLFVGRAAWTSEGLLALREVAAEHAATSSATGPRGVGATAGVHAGTPDPLDRSGAAR